MNNSMMKKRQDQKVGQGSWSTAAGYAKKANPGPRQKEQVHLCDRGISAHMVIL